MGTNNQILDETEFSFDIMEMMKREKDTLRLGPMFRKVMWTRNLPENFDPNQYTWLGGVCSLFTGDSERIRRRELSFAAAVDFAIWIETWYPRIDQVHDTVALPHKACRKVIYVIEDSIWARRLAGWTTLPENEIAAVLKDVHKRLGEPAIEHWLRRLGWRGQLNTVYTSDVEKELEIALRIWERQLGRRIGGKTRDQAKIELMYTPLWLEILGIKNGLIAEPFHHAPDPGFPCSLPNEDLAQIGYLPFWGNCGATRLLSAEEVTNRGNWQAFGSEPIWSAVNFAFSAPKPLGFALERLKERVLRDLREIYVE